MSSSSTQLNAYCILHFITQHLSPPAFQLPLTSPTRSPPHLIYNMLHSTASAVLLALATLAPIASAAPVISQQQGNSTLEARQTVDGKSWFATVSRMADFTLLTV